jgi:hypothetical protein
MMKRQWHGHTLGLVTERSYKDFMAADVDYSSQHQVGIWLFVDGLAVAKSVSNFTASCGTGTGDK